jgi:hypothetical protein
VGYWPETIITQTSEKDTNALLCGVATIISFRDGPKSIDYFLLTSDLCSKYSFVQFNRQKLMTVHRGDDTRDVATIADQALRHLEEFLRQVEAICGEEQLLELRSIWDLKQCSEPSHGPGANGIKAVVLIAHDGETHESRGTDLGLELRSLNVNDLADEDDVVGIVSGGGTVHGDAGDRDWPSAKRPSSMVVKTGDARLSTMEETRIL